MSPSINLVKRVSLLSTVKAWVLSLYANRCNPARWYVGENIAWGECHVVNMAPHTLTGKVRNAGILSLTWEEKCKRRYTFLCKSLGEFYSLYGFVPQAWEEYRSEKMKEAFALYLTSILSSGMRIPEEEDTLSLAEFIMFGYRKESKL